ncbi:UDP-glucose 4-epimerase protein [Rhizobium phage RHph_TM40]|uniref:UDP-glucose 4-epimerase protein n=2 Tax=Cuauhnahuacvirus TaxID=3044696 RepID=A0A7S5R892_9CAUD|nr:nucleotide-sugar epimerase [Rhizobium phage RHph_TM30]YP_010671408.1 nucleotide-sugar epimerase [Rhizobium phage RHph_Y65]QIG71729.1 UDP-glucose 4-epimerase protein [Rhizobium phage RHph_TM40]QIG72092.1 UDP-glucose 4-epimerase protein [Rhizobium phage RHph_TM2_3B]QIG72454.1 UDP-glucose 4-epimerase protein [Rhizobium phage RHph_TM3_3_6]QIG71365.1 UDP-glucose 4-epimerase protein [Rhizobium phage RHph_TM30]QIG72817.1 UDP-glucose 4-epimerase protein [Rhizobium phage RHph_Y65]
MNDFNVILTGSAGYIGSIVGDRLLKSNSIDLETVDVVSDVLPVDTILTEVGNLSNKSSDVLVHLAAKISVVESHKQARQYYENNCSQFHEMLNDRGNYFKHVIYASSFSIYDSDLSIYPQSVYASTKYEGEWILKRWAQMTNRDYSILRFANPIGVSQSLHSHIADRIQSSYANVMWRLARCKLLGEMFYIHDLPGMTRDFYPVEWIGYAIDWIAKNGPVGTVNLGSGKPVSVMDLLQHICEKYNISYKYVLPPEGTALGITKKVDVFKEGIPDFDTYDPVVYCEKSFLDYLSLIQNAN